ncbi:CTP-dependent riboflavin kinase [Candidatus Woesearchaeota archaeon]|nr:CTP-dependent riboflavin kinase [Candidatus Woesearchaeota archaeon]
MGWDKYLNILMHLAEYGLHHSIKTSTSEIAEKIGLSQQSASRILKEMESKALIKRNVYIDGQVISIEKAGIELLMQKHKELENIFSKKKIEFSGVVKTGIGEGKYYVGLHGYRRQFSKKMNFIPFAGTLNLKVDEQLGKRIKSSPHFIVIEGFSTKKRTYGSLKCFKAKLNNKIEAGIVLPERTNHGPDIIEIIAPFCLRDKLKLNDGDSMRVSL